MAAMAQRKIADLCQNNQCDETNQTIPLKLIKPKKPTRGKFESPRRISICSSTSVNPDHMVQPGDWLLVLMFMLCTMLTQPISAASADMIIIRTLLLLPTMGLLLPPWSWWQRQYQSLLSSPAPRFRI